MSTLAKIIETLGSLDPAMPITLGSKSGLGVHSWRGDYCQPSIDHRSSSFASGAKTNREYGFSFEEPTGYLKFEPAETVGELLTILKAVDGGAGLCGYKGGVYYANGTSTVWADPWGDCPGRFVTGVMVAGGAASLVTEEGGW